MIRRAKISVLFTLVGALTASGALLNPERRHPAFQPDRAASLPKSVVLPPAQMVVATRLWTGVEVQRITARSLAAVKVAPGLVRKAGGDR